MADSNVFGRLKKLFSTNTVVRNVGGRKLKVSDTDNIQSFVNRRGIDRYHRVYSSFTGGYGSAQGRYEAATAFQGSRLQLFRDYDMMDNDPIISSVLDIYADESTTKDEYGQILNIKTENSQIREILYNLYYDILNIEFNMWPWARNMAKYGDFFLYLDLHETYGVVNAVPLSIYETIRIEGTEPENPFSVKFKIENDFLNLGKVDFDNYEIAHFRMLADTNFLPYGKAMIEGGRRVWKQLQLMEDAMLIHRIMRAPDKRKILVDIGNIPAAEVDTFMERMMAKMKKAPLVDQRTGDYNLRYNMQNITEDIYLPIRGKQSGTDITNLPGLQFNAIEDIEYLRNKLLAAFKVPKSFIGYEEDINGKATLAAQDVRFARTIERVQRILESELKKIGMIHLYIQGYTDADLLDFDLSLTNPSVIYEQEKLNLWKEKIAVASQMLDTKLLSQKWVYLNILEMSDEEISNERLQIKLDMERAARLAQIEQDTISSSEDIPTTPLEPSKEGEETKRIEDDANKQIDDVEEILASLGNDIKKESELDTTFKSKKSKMGAPKKDGASYGTDSHAMGRDPFGRKENSDSLVTYARRKDKAKFPFALELKDFFENKKNTTLLNENLNIFDENSE